MSLLQTKKQDSKIFKQGYKIDVFSNRKLIGYISRMSMDTKEGKRLFGIDQNCWNGYCYISSSFISYRDAQEKIPEKNTRNEITWYESNFEISDHTVNVIGWDHRTTRDEEDENYSTIGMVIDEVTKMHNICKNAGFINI